MSFKSFCLFIFIILAVIFCSGCTSTANSTPMIIISSTNFNAGGDDNYNLNGEWIELANNGKYATNMQGWTLSDDGNKNIYTFPSFTLQPNSKVLILSGKGTNTNQVLFWGKESGDRQAIWNNAGDIATLKDTNGKIISQRSG